MNAIAVTGGSGFVGRHLLAALTSAPDTSVRVLSRSPMPSGLADSRNIVWVNGSLEDPDALRALLAGSRAFVHLAYPKDWTRARHAAAARQLGAIAAESSVSRVIHCSTAVVAGRAEGLVTEETPCQPATEYEKAKLEIECSLGAGLRGQCELAILRPTAVFGPGGQNLLKLATALVSGRRPVNYLRSSLYGRRQMNLVCIDNVVGALRFLLDCPGQVPDPVYLVSDDDDPLNTFAEVERMLMSAMNVEPYALPPLALPSTLLSAMLGVAGRPTDLNRRFDASRLRQAGCPRQVSLAGGLHQFARWFQDQPR